MRTFHRTKKRYSWTKKTFFFVIVFIVIFEVIFAPVQTFFFRSVTPVVDGTLESKGVFMKIFNSITHSKQELMRVIEDKDQEILGLRFENQREELIRRENQALRELLDFRETTETQSVEGDLVRIVQRPNVTNTDQFIVLYRSDSDTIGRDVFYGPYRLGKISQHIDSFATIDLLSIEDALPAILKGETITLRSQGAMLFTGQVPKSIDLNVGDVLSLEQYPDVPFVTITDVTTEETDPFWTFFAKLPVAFSQMDYVTIQ